ncbi:glycosyl transferase group 1 [Stanieria cyanosphaera PCC 7437]|uniref:Glycosyl transferase group 1 n=1 Tax=Stanieria cyanosphaera (strain ATCC 29371 / PCC 7437) TaxID=111780 RepID=K9XSS3_STAC7|nr:glycosyltransferase family 4 protein [Stanieria cyanosphaera]AFZ35121.1 glycosyl transferase group 1 [Stanieria cyanosphaera PCC 7437]
MNILMLSSTFPYPPTKGRKQLRTFHLLKQLSKNNSVTLVSQPAEDVAEEEIEYLEEQVEQLVTFSPPTASDNLGILDKAKRLGTFIQQGIAPQILDKYSPIIQEWLDHAFANGQFDVISCQDSNDEIYIRPQWREQKGIVLDLHISESGKYKQQLDPKTPEKDQFNLGWLRRYEQNYLEKFSAIVTLTSIDRRLLKELNPESQIFVIPNGVNLTHFSRRITNQGGQRLVFFGKMDNAANIDAACFLASEIFPAIRQRYPEATLELVGANPSREVLALDSLAGVRVTGEVTSVLEYLHWATVCVIPIRKRIGLTNRTLEAMAAGVPVVGSDRALAGLEVDGSNVLLRAMRANTVEEYVYAIGRLFSEPKLREKLSENGRFLVESEYTWEKVGQKYEQVLFEACQQST